ncbi:MAG: DUF2782 domain-containing protein [Betaproteobacteria bacterium]|nr:MAG: DUF2782 domain-containing protein [Betaproteobacteria bacterium]
MRPILALVVLLFAAGAFAQSAPRPRPPGTVPLEEPPPPPAVIESDPSLEPQVTIRKEGDNTVSEYRIKGKLYMMKVTPAHGRPYVLIDHRGDGQFARQDNLDSGLRVPQWVLLEF